MSAETTHRAEQELGPPIVDGVVRWASSTLLTGADHDSDGGCLRRTWYERVGGKDRETTSAMTAGVEMHKEIETYLTTGQLVLGPVAMAGRHFIPEPGPGLVVEQPIILGGDGKITGVWLYCAGVPYAGHVDLYNHRGEYIDPEGDVRRDPAGTLEVKDWKSTSDLRWAKSADAVAKTIQMNAYAMAGFKLWPSYDHARLTHVYFQRNGRPQAMLSTSRRSREQIEKRWEYAERVMRRVIDAARETDPNVVEANTKACRAYNRDCPHLRYCAAGKAAREFNSLDDVFGERMAAHLTSRMTELEDSSEAFDIFSTIKQQENSNMGLFEVIKPTTPATATAPAPGSAISLDDLVAEESAARASLDPPPPAPLPASAEFAMALGTINASALGFPKLVGRAALMFGTLNKHELRHGMEIAPRGRLEKLAPLEDPAAVVALAAEIAAKLPAAAPGAVSVVVPSAPAPTPPAPVKVQHIEPAIAIVPPDAPASNPVLAADPVEGLDTPKARELAALTSTSIPGLAESVATAGALDGVTPDLFGTAPAASTETIVVPEPAPANAAPPPVEPDKLAAPAAKATKTRAKKTTTKSTTVQAGALSQTETTTTTEEAETTISIYVDVFADGVELQSLEPYIANACKVLTDEFGGADIRCAPEQSALGYSKWKGAVTALVKRHPPGPGNWHVDTRGNEVGELVAVALRQVALESGGTYVRGMR